MDYLKLVIMYEKGIITDHEFVHSFLRLVTDKNVCDLLIAIPSHLRFAIENQANVLEGVTDLVSACISTTVCFDKEIHERREVEEHRLILEGASIVRENYERICGHCNGDGGSYKYMSDDPCNKLMCGDMWYKCCKCSGKGYK